MKRIDGISTARRCFGPHAGRESHDAPRSVTRPFGRFGRGRSVHIQSYRACGCAGRPRQSRRLPPRALRRVREYIEAHLQENVSLQALAGIAGKSTYHFARAFKQSEGLPPHEFLVRCRLRRAQELLAGTNLPLAEVALACGFADQSHFAHRFRRQVGLTPGRYRWSMR